MEFDVQYPVDGAAVIRPVGRLNMVAAPRLRELVNNTVQDGRARIVVDLADTEFIDSSGLGALIAGLKAARTAGGDLRIARPPAQVTTVLELTNLHRVLRPYGTVAEGLA
jgi:anti-sigma B factor antagonist